MALCGFQCQGHSDLVRVWKRPLLSYLPEHLELALELAMSSAVDPPGLGLFPWGGCFNLLARYTAAHYKPRLPHSSHAQ